MKKLIMVVDDDPDVVKVLKKMLMRQGYLVLGNTNPTAVINLVNAIKVDLFIVDVMMPDIDGIQLCENLRANTISNKAPIVMFSAYANDTVHKKALAAGGTTFLSKSEMSGTLLTTVNHLLDAEQTKCAC